EIGLDATALVQPLRVHDLADRNVDLVGAHPPEHCCGIRALQHELRERGLVEEPYLLPYGPVLGGRLLEPVLAAVAILVARLGARGSEPVAAREARHPAEAGAGGGRAVVQRGLARSASRLRLPERPVHRVEQPECLDGAVTQVALVALKRRAAADIE